MNSLKLGIDRLNEIVEASESNAPLEHRCALYAAARFVLDDIRGHVSAEFGKVDGYLSEKVHKIKWHIGAILGFDVDNGHDDSQHRSWAYGQISTLSDLLKEKFPDDC